jgi:hypothetical protein
MPGLLPEATSNVVATFDTPTMGTLSTLAIHKVPQNALYDSMNVFIREGKLRSRPGQVRFTTTSFAEPILCARTAVTPLERRVLAISKTNMYELGENDSAWTNTVSGVTFAPYDTSVVDMAFLEVSSTYVGIIASEGLPLRAWNSVLHTANLVTATLGTVPLAKSVCIAARRAIYLVAPHTVQWSNVFQYNAFDPLAIYKIAQTNDKGICVRTLSNLSFVLYKERSIYTARAQSGPNETAFAFAEPIKVDGPAGVNAVVDVSGTHMYMTRNGRVGIFDGTRYPQWIADGLWLFLQQDIDPLYAYRIHGTYDYRLHCVVFYYPRVEDNGAMRGMLIVNMPFEGTDVQGSPIAAFKGMSTLAVTASTDMLFANQVDRSLVFVTEPFDNKSCVLDENTTFDDDEPYDCMLQTGLVGMPQGKYTQVTTETFVERQYGHGVVNIQPVVSNTLSEVAGHTDDIDKRPISLEEDPLRQHVAFNTPVRFFGLKYTWTSDNKVRYAGGVVYGIGKV